MISLTMRAPLTVEMRLTMTEASTTPPTLTIGIDLGELSSTTSLTASRTQTCTTPNGLNDYRSVRRILPLDGIY